MVAVILAFSIITVHHGHHFSEVGFPAIVMLGEKIKGKPSVVYLYR
jgi:hypothetical protein